MFLSHCQQTSTPSPSGLDPLSQLRYFKLKFVLKGDDAAVPK